MSNPIERALRKAVGNKRYNTKLERRQRKLNKNFVWTPEKVERFANLMSRCGFGIKKSMMKCVA